MVSYKEFRFNKLFTKEYNHLLYVLFWPCYILAFVLVEHINSGSTYHVMHCKLDDMIPFCEYFLIPYVLWYVMLFATSVYMLAFDVDVFRKMMKYYIFTTIITMAIYIIYPNGQDLRPLVFERDNIFTQVLGSLYSIDTSTNVCPSLHVVFSLCMLSAWFHSKKTGIVSRFAMLVMTVLICMSISFVKQHSVIDFFAALPLCLVAEILVYWAPKYKKHG